ncbi:MAG: serine/threonine protein kinase [Cyanobacteria bacterium P01_F01_bin.53]
MLINHRYQVIRRLGEGGFGHAYLAEDTQMPSKRRCVIKQLKPLTTNSEIYQVVQERFQREAAILEKLGENHPQIPRLYAYFSENQQFYLVQEWIEGETLESILAEQGPQSEATVQQLLAALLPVLEFVHAQGIIHRDLKPDNIMLRTGAGSVQQPVLIDFGAVRETMGTVMNSHNSLASSIVIGTPGYMASEQAAGRPIPSSDLYSLGLTAIYALTGKPPQDFVSDPQTGELIWRDAASHVSPELVSVIDKAVRSHPRDRYSSANQMLTALLGEQVAEQAGEQVTKTLLPTPPLNTLPSTPSSTIKTVVASPSSGMSQTAVPQGNASTYQQSLQNTQQQPATNAPYHDAATGVNRDETNNPQPAQKRLSPVLVGLMAAAVGASAIGGGLLVSQSSGDSSLQSSSEAQSSSVSKEDIAASGRSGTVELSAESVTNDGSANDRSTKLSVTAESTLDNEGNRSSQTSVAVTRQSGDAIAPASSDAANSQGQLDSAVTPDNPDDPTFGQALSFRQDLNVDRVTVYANAGGGDPLHYGLPGDPVTLLDQVDRENGLWSLVRFESGAEGWVPEGILFWPDQAPLVVDTPKATPQNSVFQNNALPQYGWLRGIAPGNQVDVYPGPMFDPGPQHYGLVGDRVAILDSGSGYDDGLLWYRIEFESGATGWVRNDFIELP